MGRTRDLGSSKTGHRYIAEDLRELRATEGSTEHPPVMFGFETALWSTAATKAGKWYQGVGILHATGKLWRTSIVHRALYMKLLFW